MGLSVVGSETANSCDVVDHTRKRPSYPPETMRAFPGSTGDPLPAHNAAGDAADSTSTEATQSSCSNDATCVGGALARMYSNESVTSDEIPFAVRKSSIDVRKKRPFIRNSNGIGLSVSKRLLTKV